jgi:FkbM family methyltransferase
MGLRSRRHRALVSPHARLHHRAMALLSYAQRFEDIHLLRCFGEQRQGFYIDVGAGHPVYDNVSFAFYLRGWRGITVEPNPRLAALNRAVRPRDTNRQMLVGAAPGEATLYMFGEFHGLSTMVESNARAAEKEVGHAAEPLHLPVTTLTALCEESAPRNIDFLKIDVEGAEADVLRGADFQRYRPRLVVIEAIVPLDLAQAWESWEPLLTAHGYAFVWSDDLNRYYVAEEAQALAGYFASAPKWLTDVPQIGNFQGAAGDTAHPDHTLAKRIAGAAMTRLPLLDPALLLDLITVDLSHAELDRPAARTDVTAALTRVFGAAPSDDQIRDPGPGTTVRDVYARIVDSDAFRAAAGRISASYAW